MPVVGRAAAVAVQNNKRRRRKRVSNASHSSFVDENGVYHEAPVKKIKKTRTKRYLFENVGVRGNETHDKIAKWFAKLRDAKWFQTSIIGVIFLAGILVGIQTYPITDQGALDVMEILDAIVLYIFILEIVVKLVAEGNRPWDFFRDAWNVFDFLIVVVGLMPFGGNAVTALRLVRLLRVLKLVRALPKLRILVMGLLKSLSSIAYIGLLLGLLFYLYAVLGVSVFGKNDPIHMGTLHIASLTLFRCATLEDWTDVMYIAMEGCENYGYDGNEELCTNNNPTPLMSVIYFCSFIILSSMMILNLFIGVITSSMQDAKTELSADLEDEEEVDEEEMMMKRLQELYDVMQELSEEMSDLARIEKERTQAAVVTLSRKAMLRNEEMVNKTGKPLSVDDRETPTTDLGDDDDDDDDDGDNTSVARYSVDSRQSPLKSRASNASTNGNGEPPSSLPVPSFSMANANALSSLAEGTASTDDPQAQAAQIIHTASAASNNRQRD